MTTKWTCEDLRSCFSASEVLPHRVCAPSAARLCLFRYLHFFSLEYSQNFMSIFNQYSTTRLCLFSYLQFFSLEYSQNFMSCFNNQSVTWREICSWTRLCDIFPLLKRKNLVNKFNLSEIHPPDTQSLQWPVSPPWSWSSWRGHSPPIHRHTCKLKMK